MDQYYKILGLETTATLEEVEKRFNELYKEYDPNKQDDLKEFFKKEQEKVQESYNEISLSFIRQKEEVIVKDQDEKNIEDEIKEKIGIEPLYTKQEKVEEKQQIDILNNIKSFSSLKKFTICSVFFSIILLFLPWVGEINPINIVEMKNELFDTIDIDDVPFSLSLLFYFGYITTAFLVFSLFKIYKSDYRFASLLHLFNIVVLVLVMSSNYYYYENGELELLIEEKMDNISERKSHKKKIKIQEEIDEIFDDYGFTEKEQWNWMFKIMFSPSEQEELFEDMDNNEYLNSKEKRKIKKDFFDWDFTVFHFTPILFLLLFLTNWILISILSRRKRLEISR